MTIKAKFHVSGTTAPEGSTAGRVTLGAVCRGIENAVWAQATPCGTITMDIKNDAAFDRFEVGDEYEVTFRKVEKPMPGDGHQPNPVRNQHGWLVCEQCGMYVGSQKDSGVDDQKIRLHHEQYDYPTPGEEETRVEGEVALTE